MTIQPGTYKNNKNGKIVIVKRIGECYARGAKETTPHVIFNGTRNGQKFGATHFSPLEKFTADYTLEQ